MEKSEPSLVPEWLRSPGGGTSGGGFCHNLASSQADGPLLALPKRNRTYNSISNYDAPRSSFLDRTSSTNSRRSSGSNGSSKYEKNPYSRSYSSSSRNQSNKDRERSGISETWGSEFSDPWTSIIAGSIDKDTLRRSHSMISSKHSEFSQKGRVFTDLRNSSGSGNGATSVSGGTTGFQKVSFDRDFPLLGSDERPATPDIIRVLSPGLSKGVQGLSIGTSPLDGSEGWTSALAEVPLGMGSSSVGPSHAPHPHPRAAALPASSASASISSASGASNGLKIAGALVQTPARSQNVPQQSVQPQRFEVLPYMGSKRLIPMTPSVPKTLVLNPSDKLKPKTAIRSNEVVMGPKNGLQQISSLQLGNQSVRGGSARADGPKPSSTGKLLLLKPGRENGVAPALKDVPGQAFNVTSAVANVPSIGSFPSKASGYSLNAVPTVEKRLSQAQLRSRNDFFDSVRKKSVGCSSAAADSCTVVSQGVQNSDETKEMAGAPVAPTENGGEPKCNGDTCKLSKSSSDCGESDLSDDAVIYPNEEEEAFLRSLGWEENAGDDEGLTEEEINAFCQKYMNRSPALKLCRGLQLKIMTRADPQASSSAGASS